MSSSDGFSYSQPSGGSPEKVELNNEQIHALLNKLSSDEQKELTDMMRNCTTEVTTTRGLPVTAAVLGSLYFARTRLPAQFHFGPKGWPFYAIMGIASLTATNFMFMGTCRDRIKPRIDQLWKKYDIAKSSTNYDEIRRQNRGGAQGQPPPGSTENAPVQLQQQAPRVEKNPYDYTYNPPAQDTSSYGDSFTTYKPLIGETSEFYQEPKRTRRPPVSPGSPFAPEDSGFISGTPSSSSQKPSGDQGYTFS